MTNLAKLVTVEDIRGAVVALADEDPKLKFRVDAGLSDRQVLGIYADLLGGRLPQRPHRLFWVGGRAKDVSHSTIGHRR